MAAAKKSCQGVARFGKRFLLNPSPSFRRCLHSSVYDKNVDEQVRPAVVPDEVIQGGQPDKYWAPNPHTGVFGPDTKPNLGASGEGRIHTSPATNGGIDSVLEQKTFFRPLEDLDKPQHP